MGAPQRKEIEEQDRSSTSTWLVNFIKARMTRVGKGQRQIAALTGISKTRVGMIFHNDPEKRRPIHVTEVTVLLKALEIDELEAHFTAELMERAAKNEVSHDSIAYEKVIDLVSEVVRDLPAKLTEALMHLEGIEPHTIRKEHGRGLQKAVIDLVIREYQACIERRDSRPNRLISFDI